MTNLAALPRLTSVQDKYVHDEFAQAASYLLKNGELYHRLVL